MMYFRCIALLAICMILTGCPGYDDDRDLNVCLVNNSQEKIYFYLAQTMNEKPVKTLEAAALWNFSLYSKNYETKNVIIYIWKSSTITENDWEYLRENGIYDAKYDFSLDELQSLSYTIIYPTE